jgi:hypothetical protein
MRAPSKMTFFNYKKITSILRLLEPKGPLEFLKSALSTLLDLPKLWAFEPRVIQIPQELAACDATQNLLTCQA